MRHADTQSLQVTKTFTKPLILGMMLFGALVAIMAFQVSSPAHAEPQMQSIETPLEGTQIYRIKVNKAGKGSILLHCYTCPKERIRLTVTPESFAIVGGEKVSISALRTGGEDFMTGFYKAETMELTRIKVE